MESAESQGAMMLRLATAPARAQTTENDGDTTSSSSGIMRLKSVRESQLDEFAEGSQSIQLDFGKYGQSMDESFVSPQRVSNPSPEIKEAEGSAPDMSRGAAGELRRLNTTNDVQTSNMGAEVTRHLSTSLPPTSPRPAGVISPSERRTSPRKSPRKPTGAEQNVASTSKDSTIPSMQKIVAPPAFSRYQQQPRSRSNSVDSMIDDAVPRNREEFLRLKERAEYDARISVENEGKEEVPATGATTKPPSPSKSSDKRQENAIAAKPSSGKGKGKQTDGPDPITRPPSSSRLPLASSDQDSRQFVLVEPTPSISDISARSLSHPSLAVSEVNPAIQQAAALPARPPKGYNPNDPPFQRPTSSIDSMSRPAWTDPSQPLTEYEGDSQGGGSRKGGARVTRSNTRSNNSKEVVASNGAEGVQWAVPNVQVPSDPTTPDKQLGNAPNRGPPEKEKIVTPTQPNFTPAGRRLRVGASSPANELRVPRPRPVLEREREAREVAEQEIQRPSPEVLVPDSSSPDPDAVAASGLLPAFDPTAKPRSKASRSGDPAPKKSPTKREAMHRKGEAPVGTATAAVPDAGPSTRKSIAPVEVEIVVPSRTGKRTHTQAIDHGKGVQAAGDEADGPALKKRKPTSSTPVKQAKERSGPQTVDVPDVFSPSPNVRQTSATRTSPTHPPTISVQPATESLTQSSIDIPLASIASLPNVEKARGRKSSIRQKIQRRLKDKGRDDTIEDWEDATQENRNQDEDTDMRERRDEAEVSEAMKLALSGTETEESDGGDKSPTPKPLRALSYHEEMEIDKTPSPRRRSSTAPPKKKRKISKNELENTKKADADSDSSSLGGDRDDDEDFVYEPGESQEQSQLPRGSGKVDRFGIKRKEGSYKSVSPAKSSRTRARARVSASANVSTSRVAVKKEGGKSHRKRSSRPLATASALSPANTPQPARTSKGKGKAREPSPIPAPESSLNLQSEDSNTNALRVLAPWHGDGNFYPGCVVGKGNSGRYIVRFDDGEESTVLMSKIYSSIRVGDIVRVLKVAALTKYSCVVTAVSSTPLPNGKYQIKVQAQKKNVPATVESSEVFIAKGHPPSADRLISVNDIPASITKVVQAPLHTRSKSVAASIASPQHAASTRARLSTLSPTKRKPSGDGGRSGSALLTQRRPSMNASMPSRNTMYTSTPLNSSKALEGYLFVVTGIQNPERDTLSKRMREAGARVADNWEEIVSFGVGYDSVRWGPLKISGAKRVFLLSRGCSLTPKYLMALALGVPCVSDEWLKDRAAGMMVDWRSYLLPAGKSLHIKGHVSQIFHPRWCQDLPSLNHLRDDGQIRHSLRGKSVLIISSLKSKDDLGSARQIACAAGARQAEAVQSHDQAKMPFSEYDIVVFDKDEVDLADGVREAGWECVDTEWLQQCVITGAPPLPRPSV